ncbi:hypothetical protein C9374_009942 [Naegleria lovaniensis]|uniref:Uncharacterized protein n=1 Tax=Naegleria lovaniensis TaxID=51637 RepID=A0AA88KGI9_NAELO|nr:uncharacterized protein C9374_009942 [Naegleria lovaniensis]KAG2375319.1 hypothetical protein C9374_009942 [Naegleria lovaniensis]
MSSEDNKKNDQKSLSGSFGNYQYSLEERDFLQRELLKKLDSDSISKRPGPNGRDVHYVETWRAIELANLIFGFNGWSSSIMEINNDYIEETAQGKFNCGVSAIVRVSLKDGSFHEDIGYGTSDNQKCKGAAYEQAKKSAVSDGLKRALKNFGNALGLTIYDREHIKQISKPQPKKNPANNQPKPVNPYFSQSPTQAGMVSQALPSASITPTQQQLESISSSVEVSQPLVSHPMKQEEANLQLDDDIDLDSSGLSSTNGTPSTSATPPVFQKPSAMAASTPIGNTPPVFQRPKRPNEVMTSSPPNFQPSQKKTKP